MCLTTKHQNTLKLIKLQGGMDESTIIFGDSRIPLSVWAFTYTWTEHD
jgi:hypothetical protein